MLLALISKIKKIGSRLSRRGATLILCAAAPFYLVLFNIKLFVIFFDVVGARGLIHDITTAVLAPSVFYYTLTTLFILYAVFGLFLFFYWGSIGLRGLFYLAELIILFVLVGVAFGLFILLRYGIIYTFEIGELFISDSVGLQCAARFDMLSLVGSAVVLILTALALTFGVEYMSREAFAYNVIVILCTFSASIV